MGRTKRPKYAKLVQAKLLAAGGAQISLQTVYHRLKTRKHEATNKALEEVLVGLLEKEKKNLGQLIKVDELKEKLARLRDGGEEEVKNERPK